MSLSDTERQRLYEEEVYRAEVRRRLEGAKAPPTASQRFTAFFESKVGFWLLTTVFAGVYATLFTSLSNWFQRAEIAERQRAERARQDFDTVIKVVPMLTSDNPAHRQIGLSLLNGLASAKSIQPEIAAQITATLQSIVVAGAAPNATAEARTRAGEVARLVDASGSGVATAPHKGSAPTDSPVPAAKLAAAISAIALPPRVYVQVGSEARRSDADKAVEAMRLAGVLAPGIELVGAVPKKTQLRYCDAKVLDDQRDRVVHALAPVIGAVELTPLPERLCGNVRPNHFELWLGSGMP